MQSAENVVNCTLIQWLLVTLGITILNKMWPCNLDKSPLSNVKTNVSEVVIEEFNHTEKSLFVLGMCCHEPANCSSVPAPLTQSFQESPTDSLWNLWWYFRWWCQQDAVRGVGSPFPLQKHYFWQPPTDDRQSICAASKSNDAIPALFWSKNLRIGTWKGGRRMIFFFCGTLPQSCTDQWQESPLAKRFLPWNLMISWLPSQVGGCPRGTLCPCPTQNTEGTGMATE